MKKRKYSESDEKREKIFKRLEFIETSIEKYQVKAIAEIASPDEVILVLTGLYEIKALNEQLRLL
jgi:hypothetical protein